SGTLHPARLAGPGTARRPLAVESVRSILAFVRHSAFRTSLLPDRFRHGEEVKGSRSTCGSRTPRVSCDEAVEEPERGPVDGELMALTKRGKWWHGSEAPDLDEFLLTHGLGRHRRG